MREFRFAFGYAPHAPLPSALAIGFVVKSLNASRTFFALCFFLPFSLASTVRKLFRRKSSLPPARSTRSRNAAMSTSLWRASRKQRSRIFWRVIISVHPVWECHFRGGGDIILPVPGQAPQIFCAGKTNRAVKEQHVHAPAMPEQRKMMELGVVAGPFAVVGRRRVGG